MIGSCPKLETRGLTAKEETVGYIYLSVSLLPCDRQLVVDGETTDLGLSLTELGGRFGHDVRLASSHPDSELLKDAEIAVVVAEACTTEILAELELAQERNIPTVACFAERQPVPRVVHETPVVVVVRRVAAVQDAYSFVHSFFAKYRRSFARRPEAWDYSVRGRRILH
jgi:hypothetical protein